MLVVFLVVAGSAQDVYVNFEDVAAGTTDSAINMGTISKTNGNAVTFSWTGAAGKVSVENGGVGMAMVRPISVAGVSYTNLEPTKHLLCQADSGVTLQKFTWTHAASRKVSWGFHITISNFVGGFNFYVAGGEESGANYSVLSMVDDPTPYFQAETFVAPYGNNINVQNNVPMWCTGYRDSTTQVTQWQFYNATNGALIGFSTDTGGVDLNTTTATFTWGITDNHAHTTGTDYRLNNLILYTNGTVFPVWPGGNLKMLTNFSPTAVTAAHTAASNGDYIILPATNATWTSGVTISKNNLKIAGMADGVGGRPAKGTNNTIITADGGLTAFTVSGDLNTISNFQVRGDGTTDEADGFLNTGMHNRYSQLYLRELNVAIYAQDFGLVDNCVIADNWKVSRNIFPNGYYATYFPLAWSSTNFMVYEDNQFYWTSAKNQQGNENFFSSQTAQAFVIRHNYWQMDSSASPQPFIDYHGDNPPCFGCAGPLGLQVYSNYVNVISGDVSGSKWVDVRGGRSLIYSNRVVASTTVGQGITYREENAGDSPNYLVNNSYVWENKDGASGTSAMSVTDDANITAGVDYFTTALTPLVSIPYPHPMRTDASSTVPGTAPSRIGIGRGTVRVSSP